MHLAICHFIGNRINWSELTVDKDYRPNTTKTWNSSIRNTIHIWISFLIRHDQHRGVVSGKVAMADAGVLASVALSWNAADKSTGGLQTGECWVLLNTTLRSTKY